MLFTETIARALEDWVDISYKPNLKDNSGKECVLVNIIWLITYASQPASKCQLVQSKNVFGGLAISPKDATYKQVLEKSFQSLSTQNIEFSLL